MRRKRRKCWTGCAVLLARNPARWAKTRRRQTRSQLVEELYAAGAVEVLAVEIDRYEEGENSGKLVIELSQIAQDREMVLDIAGKIAESQGFDRVTDDGQKYVFVMLD